MCRAWLNLGCLAVGDGIMADQMMQTWHGSEKVACDLARCVRCHLWGRSQAEQVHVVEL